MGYKPIVVEDGQAAWEIMQQENAPKLLLLGWEMPYLTGLELCQRIRGQQDTAPAFNILCIPPTLG